jgi:ketosteroid isomerase-like protein
MAEESTTTELAKLARQYVEAMNSSDLDAAMALFAPDSVLDTGGPLGRFEGADSIRRYLADWMGAFDEFAIGVDEFADLGGGVTFVVSEQTGRPKGTGVRLRLRYANVIIWVGSRAMQITQSPDVDEARAAAERLAKGRG